MLHIDLFNHNACTGCHGSQRYHEQSAHRRRDLPTLSAVNGGTISLFADATLFMDPNTALTSAQVWTVQFEALSNPNATNPDDHVDLTGFVDVGASTFLEFNFNNLPPGQNLFETVGNTSTRWWSSARLRL